VAAHSTTRALYGAYDGPLYQVRRASDNATQDIGVLSTGGNADAAAQDAFGADKQWGYGAGAGPWIMADLEWGLFSGVTTGPSAAPTPSRAA